MARPIWSGTLGFGLVIVPVSLYAATEDHGVHFHQFEKDTADRIRYKKVNERTGQEVPAAQIVRGVDLGADEYVIVSDEELAAVAPERSRSIDILDFVDFTDIDPILYRATYYLGPRGEPAAHPYALLRAAMEETGNVGIALFVLRGSEQLVAVRPDRGILLLETMRFADEIRPVDEVVPNVPDERPTTGKELDLACRLVESLREPWDPTRYQSTYRHEVHELVERKRRGEVIRPAAAAPKGAQIVDLMEALDASLRARRGEERPPTGQPDGGAPATKAQLQARAAELGIGGRSKMSRQELADAVAAAEAGERRRAS